eukprot:12222294-Prorocentrum_lima.AAC.1
MASPNCTHRTIAISRAFPYNERGTTDNLVRPNCTPNWMTRMPSGILATMPSQEENGPSCLFGYGQGKGEAA